MLSKFDLFVFSGHKGTVTILAKGSQSKGGETAENKLYHIDGLVQERFNSSALVMELRLSCTNPSILLTIYILKPIVSLVSKQDINNQGPLLLTWFNFNPSMDK